MPSRGRSAALTMEAWPGASPLAEGRASEAAGLAEEGSTEAEEVTAVEGTGNGIHDDKASSRWEQEKHARYEQRVREMFRWKAPRHGCVGHIRPAGSGLP